MLECDNLERRTLEQQGSVSLLLSLQGLSSRVELNQGVEPGRAERCIRTHLQQVEWAEGREDAVQAVLEDRDPLDLHT